jgi:hypothetical protein
MGFDPSLKDASERLSKLVARTRMRVGMKDERKPMIGVESFLVGCRLTDVE